MKRRVNMNEVYRRRAEMPAGTHVVYDNGNIRTGVVVDSVYGQTPGTIAVRLDHNGAVVLPHVTRDDVRPLVEAQ